MTGLENFFVLLFDCVTSKLISDENTLWQETGLYRLNFQEMTHNILHKKASVYDCIKNHNSELFIMFIKALAFLGIYPHGKDNNVLQCTGYTIEQLKGIFKMLMGKELTKDEYINIMKQ